MIGFLVGLFLTIAGMWGFIGPHGGGPTPFGAVIGIVFWIAAVGIGAIGNKAGTHLTGDKRRSGLLRTILTGVVLGYFLLSVSNIAIGLARSDSAKPSALDFIGLGIAVVGVLGLAFLLTADRVRPN